MSKETESVNWEKTDELVDRIQNYLDFHNVYCKEKTDESILENPKETIVSTVEIWKYFMSESKCLRLLDIINEKDGDNREIDSEIVNHIRRINKLSMNARSYKDILVYSSMKLLVLGGLFTDDHSEIKKFITKSMSLKSLLD